LAGDSRGGRRWAGGKSFKIIKIKIKINWVGVGEKIKFPKKKKLKSRLKKGKHKKSSWDGIVIEKCPLHI